LPVRCGTRPRRNSWREERHAWPRSIPGSRRARMLCPAQGSVKRDVGASGAGWKIPRCTSSFVRKTHLRLLRLGADPRQPGGSRAAEGQKSGRLAAEKRGLNRPPLPLRRCTNLSQRVMLQGVAGVVRGARKTACRPIRTQTMPFLGRVRRLGCRFIATFAASHAAFRALARRGMPLLGALRRRRCRIPRS
jgi:hypothetical protein